MNKETPVYSAAESAAGYLYQARLALAESLRYAYVESGVEIAIEKLDDVSFAKDGSALELLQTKHHLKKSGASFSSQIRNGVKRAASRPRLRTANKADRA